MKEIFRNESGYTLLLALLLIVIIGLITPPLVSGVMNSTMQNKKSETIIQSENLLDMGKHFFRNEIATKVGELNGETTMSLNEIRNRLISIEESPPILLPAESSDQSFQVGFSSISEEKGYYRIEYTSRAIIDGKVYEEKEVVQIKNNSSGLNPNPENQNPDPEVIPDPNPDPDPEDENPSTPPVVNEGESCLLNKKKNGTITLKAKDHCILRGSFVINEHVDIKAQAKLEIYGSVIFNGNVDLKGSHKGYLLIEGPGVFNRSLDIGGSNEVRIKGSGDFQQNVSVKGNGLIDIHGSARFIKEPTISGNGSVKINNSEYR
ncbi:hypothetical protein K7887_15600 [Sutcliffiella horikoshii]|uniref:hypothetical protein n=1 Tax=Sutcliffiella horikoshii TaxID=79883 RepID=UPI001CBAEA23|nr:hypothetical protein [Sutcliffiella horikoshii]UAL46328.1 hypothetical protein K7887_15600 [Sutcliffiella horikoshii]